MKRHDKPIRSERGQLIRSTASADRSMPAVLSTGAVARDGHTVDPKGWVYGRSVPLVDSHRDYSGISSVLGKVTNIRTGTADIDSGDRVPALLGTVTFAEASVSEAAETAYLLYAAGFASSLSVSFIPLTYRPAYDRGSGCLDIESAELLECSIVAVPSDKDARILARAIRSRMSGQATAATRSVIAAAIKARIEREDIAAGGWSSAGRDRAARARQILARIIAEDMP